MDIAAPAAISAMRAAAMSWLLAAPAPTETLDGRALDLLSKALQPSAPARPTSVGVVVADVCSSRYQG